MKLTCETDEKRNADVMFSGLQELKDMGMKLSIDDFGAGYSSLSYLRQFPVSQLKIDRSFVRDVATSHDDAAIAAAIISMTKGLNLTVIAEGVETEAQMSSLRADQCDEIQGYYFSRPSIAEQAAEAARHGGAGAVCEKRDVKTAGPATAVAVVSTNRLRGVHLLCQSP